MIINHIDILDFKNIREAVLDFSEGVNCLVGLNGMGKSNLLEAIHFLSFVRPMTSLPESQLIRHGCESLVVKGRYTMDSGSEDILSCGIVRGKGKSLKRNGKEYGKMSEHIGRYPIVTVSPADTMLVAGGAEERRKLMDVVISQADAAYLSHLIRYNRALESRNKMLRAGVHDNLLYESVEMTMEESAVKVYEGRRKWIDEISPIFADFYLRISGSADKASVGYRSVLNDKPFGEVLSETRQKDFALGFTSRGVHRDDMEMGLGDYSMRRLGSQGQVKTFTIALRFAVFNYLKKASSITPLLLLDDIFDKLDAERVERIMNIVSEDSNFGQIFITDTNRKHIDEILSHVSGSPLLFEVSNGEFAEKDILK
jgi:DNA replication and repair protein RecF